MPDAQKLAILIAEYQSLDRARDADRMRQVLEEAIPEVDRAAAPKKWAALHGVLGQLRENIDPRGALDAYRKALEVWTPEEDRASWVGCHCGAGLALFALQPLTPEEIEEAIAHLEAVVTDEPFVASALDALYQLRALDDPMDKWRKRIQQLTLAQAQISRVDEPVKWARVENELAIVTAEEPEGNYFSLMAKRAARHRAALDALGDDRGGEYVETCMYVSEVCLAGAFENVEAYHRAAEEFARRALQAAQLQPNTVLQARAQLAVGRALAIGQHAGRKEDLREALGFIEPAITTFRQADKPALEANAISFRANAYAQLVRLGERQWIGPAAGDAERALQLLDPQVHPDMRRTILQAQGEALLDADQPEGAAGRFERALAVTREALAQATTPQGRMQRIWEFHNSAALLSHCYLRIGREENALQALEDGKGRFWSASERQENWEGVDRWIPAGGALLFPNFASDPGAVMVVAAAGLKVVWLPGFGRSRLRELLWGGVEPTELGGWLKAYSFQNTQFDNWLHATSSIGETLYKEVWAPVTDVLPALGVRPGAELVWFPQGGSGVFPMHAARRTDNKTQKWLLDEYAIRCAPSTKALAAAAQLTGEPGATVLVVNPTGDLQFAELESAYVLRQIGMANTQVFRGPAATKAAVAAAIGAARRIHLATHAQFDWGRPLDSHLSLAGDENLLLSELLPQLAAKPPELVVLSACETAISRVTATPDEFLGFPAALLHAGVRTVVATLWLVDDEATAALMGRFYAELSSAGTSPAEALRRAQTWLRDATEHDLRKLRSELCSDPGPVGELASQSPEPPVANPQSRPFAHPYYWAAFTVAGH